MVGEVHMKVAPGDCPLYLRGMKNVLPLDVTPLTLGVETVNGVMRPLIKRNTAIPVRKSWVFSAAEDDQATAAVHILQGERPMAVDNISLGQIILDIVPPAPRGEPRLEVTFDIDADGVLIVSARDTVSGSKQQATLTPISSLSTDDVEQWLQEAEQNAIEDERRRELAEARNAADTLIYYIESALRRPDAGTSVETWSRLASLSEDLRQARMGSNAVRIWQLVEQVQQVSSGIGQQADCESRASLIGSSNTDTA